MGLGDVCEAVGAVDRHDGVTGGDRVEQLLQHVVREVGGVAAIRGESYPAWDVLDRVKVADGRLVGEHPGEAHDAVDSCRSKGVGQGRCSDEFERSIDTVGEDPPGLGSDVAVVDEDVVDDPAQDVGSVRVAAHGQHRHAPLPRR